MSQLKLFHSNVSLCLTIPPRPFRTLGLLSSGLSPFFVRRNSGPCHQNHSRFSVRWVSQCTSGLARTRARTQRCRYVPGWSRSRTSILVSCPRSVRASPAISVASGGGLHLASSPGQAYLARGPLLRTARVAPSSNAVQGYSPRGLPGKSPKWSSTLPSSFNLCGLARTGSCAPQL